MKEKIILLILFSSSLYAQVGINTLNPTSTLTLNGSYAGAFRTVSNDVILGENDHYINIDTNNSVTITLPNVLNQVNITGRTYTIKNTSTSNAIIKGFSQGEKLRDTNENIYTNYLLPPGNSIQLIKNNFNTDINIPFWEITQASMIIVNDQEPTKSISFARSRSRPINSNTPTNSVTSIGNLIVRYNGTTNTIGYIEYQVKTPSHVTTWYQKAGGGGTRYAYWGTQVATTNNWYKLTSQTANDSNNIHARNRDVSQAIIILHNTREVYRITSNLNGRIAASDGVNVARSSATLFIEKLD